ncbi:MAG: helix-turn-helix transcriptional regulator [Crocinitomicaceae bacterium]
MISDAEIKKKFGKRVKALRLEKGHTQLSAFHETGIHFGRIEQGKRDVSITTIYKIAEYFNIPVSDLLKEF